MAKVLMVGIKPEAVDYSDPALPPGLDAKKIHAGIALALSRCRERGWEADVCMVLPDDTASATLAQKLSATRYDCIVIGAGLRLPPKNLVLFEKILNAVHKAAPGAAIAFNTAPQDSADAAARWL